MRRFGIDLGTTNTCVYMTNFSFTDREDGIYPAPVPVSIAYEIMGDVVNIVNQQRLPSLLYGRTDETGKYKYYIGEIAQRMADIDREPLLSNAKRMLCNEAPDKEVAYGLSAQSAACEILKGCRYSTARAVPERVISNQATQFCVTQPAAFNIFASASIPKAAEQANIKNVKTLREPNAALLSFLYDRLEDDSQASEIEKKKQLLTLVVDIGGGTTDVSIQQIQISGSRIADDDVATYTGYTIQFVNRGSANQRAAANTEPAFGGADFDFVLLKKIMERMEDIYYQKTSKHIDWTGRNGDYLQSQLNGQVNTWKNELSSLGEENAPDHSFVLRNLPDCDELRCKASAAENYEWTSHLCELSATDKEYDRTIYAIIADTIRRSGYNAQDIDYMFVTGGMSLYKPVRDLIKTKFAILHDSNRLFFSRTPLEDIARGAALCDSYFKVNIDSVLFSDLMIDDPCGEPWVIVERNTVLPVHGRKEKWLTLRAPSYCSVDVLYGMGPRDSSIRMLKRLRQDLNPVAKIGTAISVDYNIDESQALDITLTLHDTVNGDREVPLLNLIKQISVKEGNN